MGKLKLTTLENLTGSRSTSSDNVIAGCAKAWVNFNGTGVVAIRDSYNVSSITDNGVGDYTINFTTAMPNVNYATSGQARSSGVANGLLQSPGTSLTSSLRFSTISTAFAATDFTDVHVIVHSN